jgi:hypothetical protein
MSTMPNGSRVFAATLVATALAVGGCADTTTKKAKGDPAAKVEAIQGSEAKKITVTDLGAKRLQLATEAIRPAAGGKGLVVTYAAVVYDAKGGTWVFTSPAKNTYVRTKVSIAGIEGQDATLSAGPPAGTRVVTTGTAELLGAEAGLGA